jgi:hypothetical protein
MGLILFAMAVLWIVAGVFHILDTPATHRFYQERFPVHKARSFAFSAPALGVVLVLGTSLSKNMFWWPLRLGVLAISKGVYLRRATELQLRWQPTQPLPAPGSASSRK